MIAIQRAQLCLERTLRWLNWEQNRCEDNRCDIALLLTWNWETRVYRKAYFKKKNTTHFSFGKLWNHVLEIKKLKLLYAEEEKVFSSKSKHAKEKSVTMCKKFLPYGFDKWSTSLARVYTSEASCTQHTIKWYVPWALYATWSV